MLFNSLPKTFLVAWSVLLSFPDVCVFTVGRNELTNGFCIDDSAELLDCSEKECFSRKSGVFIENKKYVWKNGMFNHAGKTKITGFEKQK